jgi:putative spermidine/putrescine transport system permease protein
MNPTQILTGERVLKAYVLLILLFLALPIVIVVPLAFSNDVSLTFPPHGFSLHWFANILARREFASAFVNSAMIACIATAISMVIGILSAIAFVRFRFPGRETLLLLFMTPLIFPAIVFGAAFRYVILPLLRPGLLAGATFSLIISFDEFTVSMFLVGPGLMTLPLEMYNYSEFSLDPTIAAISTVLLVITSIAILIIEKLVGLGKQFS